MEIITIYFKDWDGNLYSKHHKAYCCPHCESDIIFNESDIMGSYVMCEMCDYQYKVNIKSLDHATLVKKAEVKK